MRSIWHNMPRRSFVVLLAAVFMTFLPLGFLTDVYNLGAYSPARLLGVVAFSGFIAVAFVYSIRIDRRFLPLVSRSRSPSCCSQARRRRSLRCRRSSTARFAAG